MEIINSNLTTDAVTFFLNNYLYGIEIGIIEEVVPLPEITSLGEDTVLYCGMINCRGTLIPVIDLVSRLGGKRRDFELKNSVIIIKFEQRIIGLIVDKLKTVVSLAEKEIIAKPDVLEGMNLEFISEVGIKEGQVIFLLDIRKILGIE